MKIYLCFDVVISKYKNVTELKCVYVVVCKYVNVEI